MDNRKAITFLINEYNTKQNNKKIDTYTNNIEKMEEELKKRKIHSFNKFIENIKKLPLDQIYSFQNEYKIDLPHNTNYNNGKRKIEKQGFLFSSPLLPDDIKMLFSIKRNPIVESNNYDFSLYLVMGEENDLFVTTNDNSTGNTLPCLISNGVLNKNLNILEDFGIDNKIFNYKALEDDLCKIIQDKIKDKTHELLEEEKKTIETYSRLTKEINEFEKMDEALNDVEFYSDIESKYLDWLDEKD